MNPDAPFATSRFVARPTAEVGATLAALADRAWTVTTLAGRLTLRRGRPGGTAPGGVGGVLSRVVDGGSVDVAVEVRPCGERASELLLRLRWRKAVPLDPAEVDSVLLLASLAMDRLAATVTTACARPRPAEAPLQPA